MPYTQLHTTLTFINDQLSINAIDITSPDHIQSTINLINQTIKHINTTNPDEISYPYLITEIHNNYPLIITLLAYYAADNLPAFTE